MKRLSFSGLLILALACPALAQEVYPVVEFGVGYSLLRDNELETNDIGFVASATGNATRWLGIESEFSGRFDRASWSYVGGPRLTLRRARTSSYFHLLLGGARETGLISGNSKPLEAAAHAGGGVNMWMTPKVAINFGGDYRKIYGNFGANRSEVRFNIGVVFGAGTLF